MGSQKLKTSRTLSWPAGILALPFVLVMCVVVCAFTCVAMVIAALIGKLEVTY